MRVNEARLALAPIDPDRLHAEFLQSLQDEGAVVTFSGMARPFSKSGVAIHSLFLDHHPRFTQRSLDDIAGAATERFAGIRLLVVHRCGKILPGEAIVFVAAAARHRRAAFECADYLMDRLKTDAFFWKREDRVDGSQWIEPTEADRADRARWSI